MGKNLHGGLWQHQGGWMGAGPGSRETSEEAEEELRGGSSEGRLWGG